MKIDVLFTSDNPDISGFTICKKIERDLGLKYVPPFFLRHRYYEVVDKQLFFLSVIKYGIKFKEL
jgi:hypothetical protein